MQIYNKLLVIRDVLNREIFCANHSYIYLCEIFRFPASDFVNSMNSKLSLSAINEYIIK